MSEPPGSLTLTWVIREKMFGESFGDPCYRLCFARETEGFQKLPHRISNGFLPGPGCISATLTLS